MGPGDGHGAGRSTTTLDVVETNKHGHRVQQHAAREFESLEVESGGERREKRVEEVDTAWEVVDDAGIHLDVVEREEYRQRVIGHAARGA